MIAIFMMASALPYSLPRSKMRTLLVFRLIATVSKTGVLALGIMFVFLCSSGEAPHGERTRKARGKSDALFFFQQSTHFLDFLIGVNDATGV